jgi:hypothetical protein
VASVIIGAVKPERIAGWVSPPQGAVGKIR